VSAAKPAVDLLPEARVLALCTRGDLDPADRGRIQELIESGIDGSRLVSLAERHGLAPALYRRLNAAAAPAVPAPLFARLWCRYEATARRNRAMTRELLELLRLFEANDIPALPFKGPALAELLYGDVTLREFGDLDILVRASEMDRARELLEAGGYEPAYPLRPRRERRPIDDPMHHALVHRHREKGITVELHWNTDCRLFALPGIGEAWWARRPRAEISGVSVSSLAPEELVYVLCMHGTRHRWASFGWLCDLAALIRRHPGWDGRRVLDLAEGQGTLRPLLLGLDLARALLDEPLPRPLGRRVDEDPAVSAMGVGILRRLGMTARPWPSAAGRLGSELTWCRFWPRWTGYLLRRALLPNMADWSARDLPPALDFLYYPLHAARLAAKHGARSGKSGLR
jgi:hypothetical protein